MKPVPETLSFKPLEASKEWDEGVLYAQAQNFARTVRGCLLRPSFLLIRSSILVD